jgi:hypothetical protein
LNCDKASLLCFIKHVQVCREKLFINVTKYGVNPRDLTLKGPQTSPCTNSKTSLVVVCDFFGNCFLCSLPCKQPLHT